MSTTKSNSSINGAAVNRFDPDEIRRVVELGKKRGLITAPGQRPVERANIKKNGEEVSQTAALRSQWIDVTPAMAKEWLRNNFRNRPVKEDTVRAYARDMLNGTWQTTHQGLAFNDRDDLIDGQHRLLAIVMSGCTVRMMVTFGLPSKIEGKEMTTMDCVDRGATRSVADQLTIQHGFKNGSITAMICSAIASLCCGERTRRLSVGQTLEIFRAFESAVTYVIEHKSKSAGLKSAGILAAFAFALRTEEGYWEGETKISGMFHKLNSGEGLTDGSGPIALLRSFLTSEESKLFTPTLNRGLAELALQAILLDLEGARPAKLECSLDGADHFRKLQGDRVGKIAAIFKLPEQARPAPKPSRPQPAPAPVAERNAKIFHALPAVAKPEPAPEARPKHKHRRTSADAVRTPVEDAWRSIQGGMTERVTYD